MPAPSNTAATSAIDLGPLPNTLTQTVDDAGTTYTVWYKFTATETGVAGIFAFGDLSVYKPFTLIYLDPAASPVQYIVAETQNRCVYFPVTSGLTYYIRVRKAADVSPANLSISGEYFVSTPTAPSASIAVNDDTDGFPLAIVSVADGSTLQYRQAFPAGEEADALTDGTVLVEDVAVRLSDINRLQLYTPTLGAIATVDFNSSNGWQRSFISSNKTDTFYVGWDSDFDNFSGEPSYSTIDALGNRSAFHMLGGSGLTGLCPSLDETILYYSGRNGSGDRPIKRWDLVNDVGLSDLVANLSGYTPRNIIVLNDGSLVVIYTNASLDTKIKHYSAAGATLHTHNYSTNGDVRIARSIAGDTFWIWLKPTTAGVLTGVSTFKEVQADGTVNTTVTGQIFEKGDYVGTPTATPAVRFGHSQSCPFWVTRAALSETTPPPMPDPGSQIDNSTPCCDSQSGTSSTGPVEPQISSNWYRRCASGGAVPTAADVVDDEDWSDETPPKEPDSWLTIAGASGSPSTEAAERWGLKPLSDAGRFVAARLIEVGSIERRSSDKDGHYPPARMRVVAQDDDGTMRGRLDDVDRRDIINRETKYELESYAGRKAALNPLPLLQGRIVDVQPALDRTAVIEVQDIVGAQGGVLDAEKLIGLPIGDEHPAKPESTKGKIYPIILGEHSDAGAIDATGASAEIGVLPGIDCGYTFFPDENPDPEGRTFNEALTPVTDKADVNLIGSPNGDITFPTRVLVAPIIGGEMGPPSDVPTGFLDDHGNGLGGPSDPHAHRAVWMDIAGGADDYIAWFFTVPGWHPITNPTGDTNVRYKVVSGTPSMPAWPPRNGGVGPQWDFYVDFLNLTDGDQWGVQSSSPPLNLAYTVGSPAGSTRYVYAVSALTILGESRRSTALVITDGPAVLSPTDTIALTWDPPIDHPDDVIAYRIIGRTQAGLVNYLAIVGLNESPIPLSYTDDGHEIEKPFNAGTGALVSENVWAWIVCAQGDGTVDIHTVYGSDGAEGAEPKRVALDWNAGTICGPESDGWPHAEPYRVVSGIRQSGFYARGLPLKHHRDGAVTFAWNGCGYADTSGSPTLVIDQAFRMLLLVLNEFIEKNDGEGYRDGDFGPIETFADGVPKFWTSKFEAAQDLTKTWLGDDIGYVGAIAIVEPITTGEFLRRFFVTFGGHLTSNHRGSLYPYLIDPPTGSPIVATGRIFRERMEIAQLEAHWFAKDERENRVTYAYHYNVDQQVFRNLDLTVEDAASIAAHGGDRLGVFKSDLKECFYGNDAATMADRWQRHLTLYAYAPRYVTWITNLRAITDDNGDPIRFSHRKEGLGLSGETATPGVLQHTTTNVNPYEMRQTVMLFRA